MSTEMLQYIITGLIVVYLGLLAFELVHWIIKKLTDYRKLW